MRKVFGVLMILLMILSGVLSFGNKDTAKKEAKAAKVQEVKEQKVVQKKKGTDKRRKTAKKKTSEYDFSKPVPQGKKVKMSYFSDAVFIGDSRTVGFLQCVKLPGETGYACKGNAVNTALSQVVKAKDGKQKMMLNAIKEEKYKKVYLMFGINETGWPSAKRFVNAYWKLIKTVRKYQPDAIIYVQSIYPVSKKVSAEHSYMTNKRINQFNRAILKMCKKHKLYYVDVAAALKNKNGNLPKSAAVDGVHARKKYCKKMLKYLRSHTVKAKK